ncbi:hypothetical protein NW754_016567 [Fusarium falciforme]|uniref:Centromere protein H C-terminal domain-containing protein n=1 Tax=Fusarium falciforme TaxID=195108 RepID=A0A9W8R2I1_9HYPO|nr:hypothetical protein NW754_016567 [Fusarium falciforme]KAJ4184184.1 hypothetical protein NW755_009190 [Fusarium falciforme]KAJ4259469.1 hypothetical protein NW757_002792 [Fusarium falciforme]
MADSIDQPMANGQDEASHLPISEDEEKVLALYDRIQELRLEIAIINAQRSHQPDESSSFTSEETRKAQLELLESRAKYVLRNEVIDTVVMANPILKAVHGGTEAAPVERELLPYVERRDEASIAVAQEAAKTGRVWDELTSTQSDTLLASRKNVASTAELFELAEEAKQKKTIPPNNTKMMQEQAKLEAELKVSKQRWRVMKGVASGIIAGSGIDWARDDELLDVVLDPEMEE